MSAAKASSVASSTGDPDGLLVGGAAGASKTTREEKVEEAPHKKKAKTDEAEGEDEKEGNESRSMPKGVPTKLIRKKTLVTGDGVDRLPIHTLTFEIPATEQTPSKSGDDEDDGKQKKKAILHEEVRIDMGDVVKVVVPGYKPKSYSMSALRTTTTAKEGVTTGGEFDITFKVYPNGRASGYLDALPIGSTINSFGMMKKRKRNAGKYVGIICYGVGITEGLPVAQAECSKGDATAVKLLWASRTRADTFWHTEVQQLQSKYPTKFQLIQIFSREKKEKVVEDSDDNGNSILYGRINPTILQQVFHQFQFNNNKEEIRFLVVGTKEMMNQTSTWLQQIGYNVPGDNELLISGKDKKKKNKEKHNNKKKDKEKKQKEAKEQELEE